MTSPEKHKGLVAEKKSDNTGKKERRVKKQTALYAGIGVLYEKRGISNLW